MHRISSATLLDTFQRPGIPCAPCCANKLSQNALQKCARPLRKRPKGRERKRVRNETRGSAGGKSEEKRYRQRERNARTRARRSRLSGQFESIKPKVAAGLCSSTRSLATSPPFPGGSRASKPAIFTLHRQPRHSGPQRSSLPPLPSSLALYQPSSHSSHGRNDPALTRA